MKGLMGAMTPKILGARTKIVQIIVLGAFVAGGRYG